MYLPLVVSFLYLELYGESSHYVYANEWLWWLNAGLVQMSHAPLLEKMTPN